MRVHFTIAAALACGACHETDATVGGMEEVVTMPAIPNPDLDVLFVIDNSPSMLDKQNSLTASFPLMMDALASLPDGMPNLHIGVVTSDMGTSASQTPDPGPAIGSGQGACSGFGLDGVLQHASPALTGNYILDVDDGMGGRTTNYTGQLRDVFQQIASVGANGCGFEQHLASMRRALTNPANGDFLRPTANLAVIILADEDDCSMSHSELVGADTDTLGPLQSFRCTRFGVTCDTEGATPDQMNEVGTKDHCHANATSDYVEDVQPFVDFLDGVKSDEHMVMVAVVAGDPTPVQTELRPPPGGGTSIPALGHSCTFNAPLGEEVADPAVRLNQLVGAFGARGNFSTVCNADLSVSLTSVGYSAKKLMGDPCVMDKLLDTSKAPGIQPSCEVEDEGYAAPIPQCDGTNFDRCWQMVVDAQACPTAPDHLKFEVLREALPPVEVYTTARCAISM